MTIFHTSILSNFNFCPLSWHFCSKTNTNKIEKKIQERELRFVYDDFNSSYTELLTKANLPTLETRRIRTMAIGTFKILNGLAPSVLSDRFIKRENKYNFRYFNILQIPQVRASTQGKKSFRYAAPVLWNSLPGDFRNTVDFNGFKSLISHWNGEICKCAACSATF